MQYIIQHESMERQPQIDYYNNLKEMCYHMYSKYSYSNRTDNHHICAYFNLKDNRVFFGENSIHQQPSFPISTHAEIDALRKVLKNTKNLKRLDKYDILVIRTSKTGKLGSSRPCYHCINSLQSNQLIKIRYVYYSTSDGKILREKIDDMIDSELTCFSTGWHVHVNRKKNNIKK